MDVKIIDGIIKYEDIEIDCTKDYREILNIPRDATQKKILDICAYALEHYSDKEEFKKAAKILMDPEATRLYNIGKDKIALEKEKEEEKNARIADAEAKKERKKRDAERRQAARLARDKKRIERKTKRNQERIAKNIETQKERGFEKIVESYDSSIAATTARNTIKRYSTGKVALLVIISTLITTSLITGYINRDAIKEKYTTLFDKDDDKELNYNEEINNVDATLEEEEVVIAANAKVMEKESYPIVFTDPFDEEQIKARATALSKNFEANNFHDIDKDEIINQIKFFNGSYEATTDEAYNMQDSILNTFTSFKSTIASNDTFITGISTSEGETVGLGLDAYLLDTSPNKEIVTETFEKFKNLFTAKTAQEQVDAANELIILEYELKTGTKQNSNGEYISYAELEPNEGVIIGLMNQLSNNICPSILSEDRQVSYTNNNGEQILISFDDIQNYYNPYNGEELDYDNTWVVFCADLVSDVESLKKSYN